MSGTLDRWALGPYGPGCGEPSWKCRRCGEWFEDLRNDQAACVVCGYDGWDAFLLAPDYEPSPSVFDGVESAGEWLDRAAAFYTPLDAAIRAIVVPRGCEVEWLSAVLHWTVRGPQAVIDGVRRGALCDLPAHVVEDCPVTLPEIR